MADAAATTSTPAATTEATPAGASSSPDDVIALPSQPSIKRTRAQWDDHLTTELVEKRRGLMFIGMPPGVNLRDADDRPVVMTTEDLFAVAGPRSRPQLDAVWSTVPDSKKLDSLADFNYGWDAEGVLRNKANGDKFAFVSQRHYDALGDLVLADIQAQMEKDYGLKRVTIPASSASGSASATAPSSYIYASADVESNSDKLLLLIQGSGVVRPGQWARSVCTNESLTTGAILPYLRKAQEAGMAVLVFNPNQNFEEAAAPYLDAARGKPRSYFLTRAKSPVKKLDKATAARVPGSENPLKHVVYVWDTFATKSPARDVFIVAHSAGGAGTFNLLRQRTSDVFKRLRAVAFTDATHFFLPTDPPAVQAFMSKNCTDWVASTDALDTPQPDQEGEDGIKCVSAGHPKHEYTSGYCIASVFPFLLSRATADAAPVSATAAPVSATAATAAGAGGGAGAS